jgi:hypothetical protein
MRPLTSRCSRLRGAPKRHFGAGGGKAEGRFAALPVVASRAMRLGNTVATVGFPNVGLQGCAPKLARGEIAALSGVQDDARHFQISVSFGEHARLACADRRPRRSA